MAEQHRITTADAEQLYENGTIIVFKCDIGENFPLTFVSKNAIDILGFEPEYLTSNSTSWSSQIHPEDRQRVLVQFQNILSKNGAAVSEYRFQKKDGSYIWLRNEIQVQKSDEREEQFILGTSYDITEHKTSEFEANKKIEQELRGRLSYQHALSQFSNLLIDTAQNTIEHALEILLKVTDTDRIYIFTNSKDKQGNIRISQKHEVCREGVTPEIDNPDLQNMAPESLPWVFTQLSENRVVNTPISELPSPEKEFMLEENIKSFLLLPIFIEDDWFGFMGFDSTRVTRIWDEHEIVVLKTAADIIGTYFKRKAAESSLLHQQEFTRQLLDSLPSITVLVDKKMQIQMWNKTTEEITGYTAEDFRSMHPFEMIAPEDHKYVEGALSRIINKENEGQELTLRFKNGRQSPFFWRGNLIQLEGEQYFLIVGLNITHQKEIEKALVEEKRMADAIINSLPGIFYILNTEGRYVRVNENFVKEFGYSEKELLQMNAFDLNDEEELPLLQEKIQQVIEKGEADAELNPITKSGEKIPYYLKAVHFKRDGKSYVLGTGHNISEQKNREAELHASLNEKQILLQEIHHRVKNNLAVISGLLELQAHDFDNPVFRRMVLESQRRIQTMAMIHEKLYQSEDLSKISVLEYVDDLVHQIEKGLNLRDKDVKIETEIADIDLNINQAVPFALAVNEIVSNALEHAFKGIENGMLNIKIEEREGSVHTMIEDNGIGFEESENKSSLGMTLIKTLLTQIEADWSMDGSDGVTYNIAFPKSKGKSGSAALEQIQNKK